MRPAPPGFDPDIWSVLETARAQSEAGDTATALSSYAALWETCINKRDHYHASVVAHLAGVAESDIPKKHEWNLRALREAEAVPDQSRVKETYASTLNNLGMSYAQLGHHEKAREIFDRAVRSADDLAPGPYADAVRSGIERNIARLRG